MPHKSLYKLIILHVFLFVSSLTFVFDGYTVHGFRDLEFGDSIKMVIEKTDKYCKLIKYWEAKSESQYRCGKYQFLGKPFEFSAIFWQGKLATIGLSLANGKAFYAAHIEPQLKKKYGIPEKYISRLLVLEFKDGVGVLLGDDESEDNVFITYSSKEQIQRNNLCTNEPEKCPE